MGQNHVKQPSKPNHLETNYVKQMDQLNSAGYEQRKLKEDFYLQVYQIEFENEYIMPPFVKSIQMDDMGLRFILSQPWKIETLKLDGQMLTATGIQFLVKSQWKSLKKISLQGNKLGNEGVKALSRGDWQQLQELNLTQTQLEESCIDILSNSRWKKLTKLYLSICVVNICKNIIGPQAMLSLSLPKWQGLQQLRFDKAEIGQRGCKYLVRAKLQQLKELRLQHNYIGQEGVCYLAKAKWKSLKILDISSNRITGEALKWLASADWKKMKAFLIVHNVLGEQLRGFVKMPWQCLTTLRLQYNNISQEYVREYFKKILQMKFGITTSIMN